MSASKFHLMIHILQDHYQFDVEFSLDQLQLGN